MAKKKVKKLPKAKREFIEDFYQVLDKEDIELLSKQEKAYLLKVKAKEAKREREEEIKTAKIKVDGKVYRGEVAHAVIKSAKNIGVSPSKFIKDNKKEVIDLIDSDQVRLRRSPDNIIDQIHGNRKMKYFIDDGNGKVKVTKKEAMRQISEFQNFVRSNTDIVDIRVPFRKKLNGEFIIEIPLADEYEDVEGDEEAIDDLLEIHDVFFARSPKK